MILPILLAFFCVDTHAANISFTGRLREKGTKNPLPGMNIFVLPQKIKTVTDEDGSFKIEIPEGPFQWVVNAAGYLKLERDDEAVTGALSNERDLFLEKSSYLVYETTIYGKANKRDDTTKTLKAEQFLTMPGSGGDPIKAVQNLAGVNRPAPFQSQIIIQGSGPNDTKYAVDSHEVPLIFHFGGLTSVVFPDAIDRVDFMSAGYGPEFGRASGGLVGVWTRNPKRDRMHGLAYVDIFNAGAMFEGPIGKKSSLLLGARRAYIGEVLRTVFKNNSDFNLSVAPSYSDFTGVFTSELTDKDDFKITSVASHDILEFVLKQPIKQDPALRGDFKNTTDFFRFIPELEHRHSESTTTRYSLGVGRDFINVMSSENYFKLNTYALTSRAEIEKKITREWTGMLGVDNKIDWYMVSLSFPKTGGGGGVPTPISSGERITQSANGRNNLLGGYLRNELHFGESKFTWLPNMRVDYYSQTNEILPGPRPAIRYAFDDSLTLRTSGGLYYQPPQPQESDSVWGNPEIKSPRAWHADVGADKDWRGGRSDGFITNIDVFYKILDRQVITSSDKVVRNGKIVTENFSNKGEGEIYGTQAQVRYEAKPYTVGLNYTLSKSTRTTPSQGTFPFQYDQTHLVGLLGSYDVRNWRYAARFRYATGNPYTPVTGASWDADGDVFVPRRGAFYSQRLEPFYQLDIRIDHKWIYDKWILSAYLDVQNVTNRKNPESIVYAYDYSKSDRISGLPILPTLGVKGEF